MTGEDVLQVRQQLGLTPAQLGELIGTSVSSIYRWEAAGTRSVPIEPFQLRLLLVMQQQLANASSARREAIATGIAQALIVGGGLLALFSLLGAIFDGDAEQRRRMLPAATTPKRRQAPKGPSTKRRKEKISR